MNRTFLHCPSLRLRVNFPTAIVTANRPSVKLSSIFAPSIQTHTIHSTSSFISSTRGFKSLQSQRNNMSFSNADTGDKPADPYKAKNKEEPTLSEKVEDLSTFISACKFGMMTTRIADTGMLVSRCMALAAKESGGIDLIFHTNTESGKTDDIESDPTINIAFLNGTGEWASISGTSSIITDRSVVKKYYSPALKAWLGDLGDGTHDGSANDPRIGVIKVEAKTATYAIARSNMISRGVELVQGVLTGNSPQVNKLREINESEISEWRSKSG